MRLSQLGPKDVADFIGWLVKQRNGNGGTLSDKSVRNTPPGPLTACLATARREGLIPHNPATGAALPHRPRIDDDDERPRPFPRIEQDGDTRPRVSVCASMRRSRCSRRRRLQRATTLDPERAGRRAVDRHGEALKRLAD
jgi:hypothetical protein